MNPLDIAAKLLPPGLAGLVRTALAVIAALAIGYLWGGWGEFARGERSERAVWLGKEVQRKEAERLAIEKRNRENDAIRIGQEKHNWMVTHDYETKLEAMRRDAAADRAAVRSAGGLRVSRAICDQPARAPEADSTASRDEAAAATVALPQQVDDDLWRLALDSDEIVEQARACQNWVIKHGFVPEP